MACSRRRARPSRARTSGRAGRSRASTRSRGRSRTSRRPQKDQVSGGDGTDYVAQLKAKDAEIEALISWLCAKRWCQHLGKGMRPPPRIFSYHAETIGDGHADTVAHEAPAMSPADMPSTDEGTIGFRRLADRLVLVFTKKWSE